MLAGSSDASFIPAVESCQIQIASSPSTLLDEDLRVSQAGLLRQDELDMTSSAADVLHMLPSVDPPIWSPGNLIKPTLDSLRSEGPLIPHSSSSPSTSKADLPGILKGLQADQMSDTLEAQGETGPEDIFSDGPLAVLKGHSEYVLNSIEHARLQSSDVEARVPTPVLDFTIPEPEWQKVPLDSSSQWNWIREKAGGIFQNLSCAGLPSSAKLCWIPFPSEVAHISLQEHVEGNETLKLLLDFVEPLGVPIGADFVWKRSCLTRLLDPEEDDLEELQPISKKRKGDNDLDSPARKRANRWSLGTDTQGLSGTSSPVDLIQMPENVVENPIGAALSEQNRNTSLLIRDDDGSAVTTLISNYINFTMAKGHEYTNTPFFPVPGRVGAESKHSIIASPIPITNQTKPAMISSGAESHKVTLAPCPYIPTPLPPTTIIKSLALSRGVFSRLTRLYPDVKIIERDFDRWNSVG